MKKKYIILFCSLSLAVPYSQGKTIEAPPSEKELIGVWKGMTEHHALAYLDLKLNGTGVFGLSSLGETESAWKVTSWSLDGFKFHAELKSHWPNSPRYWLSGKAHNGWIEVTFEEGEAGWNSSRVFLYSKERFDTSFSEIQKESEQVLEKLNLSNSHDQEK